MGGDKKDGGLNAPLWKVWGMLRPSVKDMFTKEPEMLGMIAMCCLRAVELRMTTATVRLMDATLLSRSVKDFKRGAVLTFGVAMFGSWLNICYSYCQSRLQWKWYENASYIRYDTYIRIYVSSQHSLPQE